MEHCTKRDIEDEHVKNSGYDSSLNSGSSIDNESSSDCAGLPKRKDPSLNDDRETRKAWNKLKASEKR